MGNNGKGHFDLNAILLICVSGFRFAFVPVPIEMKNRKFNYRPRVYVECDIDGKGIRKKYEIGVDELGLRFHCLMRSRLNMSLQNLVESCWTNLSRISYSDSNDGAVHISFRIPRTFRIVSSNQFRLCFVYLFGEDLWCPTLFQ